MKIDWEQRRYEIAKEVTAAFIAGPSYQLCVNNNYYEASLAQPWVVAENAVEYADALIEELKKPKRGHEEKMNTPPNLYFAIAYTPKKGRSKAVRAIQEYAADVDGCLVSEDGIDRIIKARNAIAAAYSSTVGDVEVVELEDGLRRVRLCRGCTIIFRRVRRMI